MKNLLYLFLTVSIISFTSCSKDEEDAVDPIVGTWFLFSYDGELVDECESQSNVTFREDGTVTSIDFYQSEISSIDEDGNITIDSSECTSDTYGFSWENNNDGTYTFIDSEEPDYSEIYTTSFSDNNQTLTIISTYTETYDFNGDGVDETITETETIVFKK